jgi:hypothetical protein
MHFIVSSFGYKPNISDSDFASVIKYSHGQSVELVPVLRRINFMMPQVLSFPLLTINGLYFIKRYNKLNLWPWSWTFTVQHTIYVKCEYFMNQEG